MAKDVKLIMAHVTVDQLKDYSANSRTHTQAQINKIAAAIEEFGFINPVIVGKDNVIIAGHARVRAAKLIGLTTVPCVNVQHLTEAQTRAYVIADNRLGEDAGWDQAILRSELHLLNDGGFNVRLTGMADEELKELVQLGDYTPTLDPTRGSDAFTQTEVDRAQRNLSGQYDTAGQQVLVPVTCPHCGGEFSVQASALK